MVTTLAATRAMRRVARAEDGLSLVEMMIALLLLAVILAGTAGSFIAFLQTSLVNETRVKATSYLNQLHEELQSVSWEQAMLYEEEIGDLEEVGADLGSEPTFGGEDLALLEGPNDPFCDPDEDSGCDRFSAAPVPHETVNVDGRSYEVFRIVTKADGYPDMKRFTTIIRWEVLGRSVEEQFESVRAPDAADLEDSEQPDVLTFDITPASSPVDSEGANASEVSVTARFNRGIDGAEIRYVRLDGDDEPENHALPLEGTLFEGSKATHFETSLDVGEERFPTGQQGVELVGFDGSEELVATTQVEFLPPGEVGDDTPSVQTPVVTPTSSNIEVRDHPNKQDLCDTFTIEVDVDGLQEEGTVTLKSEDGYFEGRDMHSTQPITGTNDRFEYEFTQGISSPWAIGESERFSVSARNPGGEESATKTSTKVDFVASSGSGNSC